MIAEPERPGLAQRELTELRCFAGIELSMTAELRHAVSKPPPAMCACVPACARQLLRRVPGIH